MKNEEGIEAVCRHLAGQLRNRREQLDLSVNRLAELTGLNRQAITFVERFERTPSISTFLRLARALKLDPSDMWRIAERECPGTGQEENGS